MVVICIDKTDIFKTFVKNKSLIMRFIDHFFICCRASYRALKQILRLARAVSPIGMRTFLMCFVMAQCCLIGANIMIHVHDTQEKHENVRARLQSRMDALSSRLERHVAFMAYSSENTSSENHDECLWKGSPFTIKNLFFEEDIEPTRDVTATRFFKNTHLTIRRPIAKGDQSFVLRISFKSLEEYLGVDRLSRTTHGEPLHTKWGTLGYQIRSESFLESFMKHRASAIFLFFLYEVALLSLAVCIYVSALISSRRFKESDLCLSQQQIVDLEKKLNCALQESVVFQKQQKMHKRKALFESQLRQYVKERTALQIDKVAALSTLVRGACFGGQAMDEASFSQLMESLIASTKQLQEGDIESAKRERVCLDDILAHVEAILAPELERADVKFSWDNTLQNMFLEIDPNASKLFLLCFFKDMLARSFKGSTIHVSQSQSQETILCVEIRGGHIDGNVTFLDGDIDVCVTRLSRQGFSRLGQKLGISYQTHEHEFILTFYPNTPQQEKGFLHERHDNVIPLFA